MPSAHATTESSETLLQTVRVFYRLALGMTTADYAALPAQAQDIVGQGGMLAKLNAAKNTVVSSILSKRSDVTSCQTVPASGSFSDGGLTVTFAPPQATAPAGYPEGGVEIYEKRIAAELVDGTETTKVAIEFNCGVEATMIALKFTDSGKAATNHSVAIFFHQESSSANNKYFQFYMDFLGKKFGIAVQQDNANDQFKAWVTSGRPADDGKSGVAGQGYRIAAIGHLDSGEVSFLGDYTSSRNAPGAIGDTAVTTTRKPSDGVPYQGCADSFDSDLSTINSNALCGSDVLSAFNPAASVGVTDFSTEKAFQDISAGIDSLL